MLLTTKLIWLGIHHLQMLCLIIVWNLAQCANANVWFQIFSWLLSNVSCLRKTIEIVNSATRSLCIKMCSSNVPAVIKRTCERIKKIVCSENQSLSNHYVFGLASQSLFRQVSMHFENSDIEYSCCCRLNTGFPVIEEPISERICGRL